MDGRIRHDIRHPVATISMIASTMAAFGGQVDPGTLESYRAQIRQELIDLENLMESHGVELDLADIKHAVVKFSAVDVADSAEDLEKACQRLIDQITGLGDSDAT